MTEIFFNESKFFIFPHCEMWVFSLGCCASKAVIECGKCIRSRDTFHQQIVYYTQCGNCWNLLSPCFFKNSVKSTYSWKSTSYVMWIDFTNYFSNYFSNASYFFPHCATEYKKMKIYSHLKNVLCYQFTLDDIDIMHSVEK